MSYSAEAIQQRAQRAVQKVKKIAINYGAESSSVLGWSQYLRLLGRTCKEAPALLRAGDLKPVDRSMGDRAIQIHYRGKRFRIDAETTDRVIDDGTYTFGGIREIYIRDCYFRGQDFSRLGPKPVVLDLGANRGLFSTLMAAFGARVVCVETRNDFVAAIQANMAINGFSNYEIASVFIGEGGRYAGHTSGMEYISPLSLLDRYQLNWIDMVKVDIEGSEFSLFEDPTWLKRVGMLSMEVHPEWGNPQMILDVLRAQGFEVRISDPLFQPCSPDKAEFLYAWRSKGVVDGASNPASRR